jgi:hypothetical protein
MQDPTMQSKLDEAPAKSPVHIGAVLRDVVIIWVLTFIGGFIVGFAASIASGGQPLDQQKLILAAAISNLLLGTVGFTISGCLAPSDRWQHLIIVGIGTWLTGLLNVFLQTITLTQWLASAFFVALIMSVGGLVSYIFKR